MTSSHALPLFALRSGVVLFLLSQKPTAAAQWVFREVALESGLAAWHVPPEASPCMAQPQSACLAWQMASGFAYGDVDGDGFDDVVVARHMAGTLVFLGDGAGTFQRRSLGLGLDDPVAGGSPALVDVDGDGDLDLFVPGNAGPGHYLYRNLSEGGALRFEEVGQQAGVRMSGERWATSTAVGDIDLDGDPDLLVSEWSLDPTCVSGATTFFRNLGPAEPGRFRDETHAIGLTTRTARGGAEQHHEAIIADLDADGWPDVWQSGDFGTSNLYWNDEGVLRRAPPPDSPGQNDMGATLLDYDADGLPDIFTTGILVPGADWDGNRLYRNQGARSFTDVTTVSGVRNTGWAWGVESADLDLDGDEDLVVASGWATSGDSPIFLLERTQDAFRLAGASGSLPDSVGQSRGVAAVDIDGDGDLDVLASYFSGRLRLFRNDAATGPAWLHITPITHDGRAAYGAVVKVTDPTSRQQVRFLGSEGGFAAHVVPRAHFGFGALPADAQLDVSVRFQDGTIEARTVEANQRISIRATAALIPPPEVVRAWDCDGDMAPDACDMDCDGDGRSDVCEIRDDPTLDCDQSRGLDTCEMDLGLAQDCDGSSIPDSCELTTLTDCDGDQVLDRCQLARVCLPPVELTDAGTESDLGTFDAARGDVATQSPLRAGRCAALVPTAPGSVPWGVLAVGLLVYARLTGRRGRQG